MKKVLLSALIVLSSFGLFSSVAFAQTNSQADECEFLRQKFQNSGGDQLVGSLPIYCTEGSIFTKITTFLYGIVAIVAVIMIVYGGYVYMTARGNDEQRRRGRLILTWTIIGLLVVLFAVLIVTVVSRFVVDNRLF